MGTRDGQSPLRPRQTTRRSVLGYAELWPAPCHHPLAVVALLPESWVSDIRLAEMPLEILGRAAGQPSRLPRLQRHRGCLLHELALGGIRSINTSLSLKTNPEWSSRTRFRNGSR